MSFAEALQKEMKRRRMTQAEMARLLRLSEGTISRYLSGERTPSFDQLFHICDRLRMDANVLLGLKH